MPDLPAFDDLPTTPAGARSGWGVFGEDDNVGLPNLMTPEIVVSASRLIQTGRVFPLDAPYNAFEPSLSPNRTSARRELIHQEGSIHFDDRYDNFHPQGSSQWDALGHVGAAPDAFYNGASEEDVRLGRRNTIERWAARGMVGRGVLLDLSETVSPHGTDAAYTMKTEITVEQLERARITAGVDLESGDVLIVHTGFAGWCVRQGPSARQTVRQHGHAVGLEASEAMCRYLWDAHISALGTDTFAVEAFPPRLDDPFGFLHRVLIGQFGMALGELWWTEDLAQACLTDDKYEFFFASSPMNAPGGMGSPANALAIM